MSVADERAASNPVLIMVDEATGERYARAVGHKGTTSTDLDWLVRDMSEELKSWGHHGGENGHIILKTDGEAAIVALRDAVAKFHGGRIVPELPPRGHHQSNGLVEEAERQPESIAEYSSSKSRRVRDTPSKRQPICPNG